MDWLLAAGGLILMLLGVIGMFRPALLWRLYVLEPRWRKDNPEKPDDWTAKSKRQGYIFSTLGVIFILLSFVLNV
ncbi:MAG: hypothetical protein Q9P01_01700 [Anaerolineae bacterium]|nr:hypothetical protein [Anaerolineae bacterium]MDQ7033576.1 hypothetical protein [Anaerolineae bacterium]